MSDFTKYDGKNEQAPAQVGSMVPISYIVRSVQNELGDYSENNYKRLLQLAIDGVREMRLFNQISLQVLYVTPNDAGIVHLPPDYVDYCKIGLPLNGLLYNLTVNENMLINRATKCGIDVRQISSGIPVPNSLGGYYYTPHFRGTNFIGGLYGLTGGFNVAYYRVDKEAGQIEFDGFIQGREIVMEYASTGISSGTILAPETIEPLKRWVHWKRVNYDIRVPMNVKQQLKEQYDEAVEMLRTFNSMFTLQEYFDLCYKTRRQSPKW